jgi:hypothetical protein
MNTVSSSANIVATSNSDKTQAALSARPSFAPRDFLKMLAAAVASGVGVSIVAAGLALALSNSAGAETLQKNAIVKATSTQSLQAATVALQPTVGGLYIGGGYDREPVDAVERDWLVKVDGHSTQMHAEVRVMQTFLMPAEGPTTAFFEATLPPNARLIALKAHTPEKILSGKVMAMDDFAGMSRQELNKFSRHDALIMWNDEGTLSTDQIMNLIPNETVVVEYTYSINIPLQNGLHEFDLVLNNADATENEMISANKPNLTSGTVWVEWLGAKPKRLSDMPIDVTLEESAQGITGLSWFTPSLAPATATKAIKFAWEMDAPISKTRIANRQQ